ncbi:MAG: hypothetical protein WCS73_00025 [Lentisphaeria bacterium]
MVMQYKKDPEKRMTCDIFSAGELGLRIERLLERLQKDYYTTDHIFKTFPDDYSWPGDFEGRVVLALTLLAQCVGKEPDNLKQIIAQFPVQMNEKGYFGIVKKDDVIDEQVLASHGWVLRALCEYYLWEKKEDCLVMIHRILDSLIMPLANKMASYPKNPDDRNDKTGGFIGAGCDDVVNGWKLSTDIGCVYILLDGLVQAYAITEREEMIPIIESMVNLYPQIDTLAIHAQTHATLTTLRGLLRWYKIKPSEQLLKIVVDKYALYRSEGMTENYENYNWFGKPTHTEPCGIIDSFMVAVQLWKITGNIHYLEDAHLIYYNGICATQQKNGGFEIHNCSGASTEPLKILAEEAYWCCTMRGGEGLSFLHNNLYQIQKDTIVIPFFNDGKLETDDVCVEQLTEYPLNGQTSFKIHTTKPLVLKLFAPSWTENHRVSVNESPVQTLVKDGFITVTVSNDDQIKYQFDLIKKSYDPINKYTIPGYRTFRNGVLVMSSNRDNPQYVYHLMSEKRKKDDWSLPINCGKLQK